MKPQSHYRVYSLDGLTGAIVAGEDLIADTDAAALTKGIALLADRCTEFELWCGTRRVHRGSAPGPAAA